MANDVAGRPWRLDTPGTTVLWSSWIKVAHFEFAGYSNATDNVVIKDQNGRTVWVASGTTDKQEVRSGKVGWINGLVLATLTASGVVTAYIE